MAGAKDFPATTPLRQLVLAAGDVPDFDITTGHEVVADGAPAVMR